MRENYIYILESLQESYSLKSNAVVYTIQTASFPYLLSTYIKRESHKKWVNTQLPSRIVVLLQAGLFC